MFRWQKAAAAKAVMPKPEATAEEAYVETAAAAGVGFHSAEGATGHGYTGSVPLDDIIESVGSFRSPQRDFNPARSPGDRTVDTDDVTQHKHSYPVFVPGRGARHSSNLSSAAIGTDIVVFDLDWKKLLGDAEKSKEEGSYQKALLYYNTIDELCPREFKPFLYTAISDTYLLLKEYSKAVEFAQRGLTFRSAPINLKAVLLGNLGEAFQNMECFDQAESVYKQAIVLDSSYFLAHIGLGFLYFRRSEIDRQKALFYFGEGFKIAEYNPKATEGLNPDEKIWVTKMVELQTKLLRAHYSEIGDEDISLDGSGAAHTHTVTKERLKAEFDSIIRSSKDFVDRGDASGAGVLWKKMQELARQIQDQKNAFEAALKAQEIRDRLQDEAIQKVQQEAFEGLAKVCAELKEKPSRTELSEVLEDEAELRDYNTNIATNEKLNEYCRAFVSTFNKAFNACFIQSSGRIKISGTSIDLKGIFDLIPVPIVKELAGLLVLGINKGLEIKEYNATIRLASLSSSITEMEKIVGKLALKLTHKKEAEIEAAGSDSPALSWYGKLHAMAKKAWDRASAAAYEDPYPTVAAKLGAADATKLLADCLSGKFKGDTSPALLLKEMTDYYIPEEGESKSNISETISTGLGIISRIAGAVSSVASAAGADTVATIADYIGSTSDTAAIAVEHRGDVSEELSTASDIHTDRSTGAGAMPAVLTVGIPRAATGASAFATDLPGTPALISPEQLAASAPTVYRGSLCAIAASIEHLSPKDGRADHPRSDFPRKAITPRPTEALSEVPEGSRDDDSVDDGDKSPAVHSPVRLPASTKGTTSFRPTVHVANAAAAASDDEGSGDHSDDTATARAASGGRHVSEANTKSCGTSNCIIMAVTRIIYDNPVLNDPDLLEKARKAGGADLLSTIIELSSEGYDLDSLGQLVEIYS